MVTGGNQSLCKLSVVCYPNVELSAELYIDPHIETARSLALRLFWKIDAPFGSVVEYSLDIEDLFSGWCLCTPDRVLVRSQLRPLANIMHVGPELALCFVNTQAPFVLDYMVSGSVVGNPLNIEAFPHMKFSDLVAAIEKRVIQPHLGEALALVPESMPFAVDECTLARSLLELGIGTVSRLRFTLSSHIPARSSQKVLYSHIMLVVATNSPVPYVIYYDPNLHTPRQLLNHVKVISLAQRNSWMPTSSLKPVALRVISEPERHNHNVISLHGARADLPFSGWQIMHPAVAMGRTAVIKVDWRR